MGSSPSGPSGPSAPTSPSGPSSPNTTVSLGTGLLDNPGAFNTTAQLSIYTIASTLDPNGSLQNIALANLDQWLVTSDVLTSISQFRNNTILNTRPYGSSELYGGTTALVFSGWASHINNRTVVGNVTTTYYSFIVIPTGLSALARFRPSITVTNTDTVNPKTVAVELGLHSTYVTTTSAYATPPTLTWTTSEKTITIPANSSTTVSFDDDIPAAYTGLAATANAFVYIGINDTSAVYRASFDFKIDFYSLALIAGGGSN